MRLSEIKERRRAKDVSKGVSLSRNVPGSHNSETDSE